MRVDRPGRLFDRDREWALLERFWDQERAGARLGIAYGRRRQGKTALLEAFAESTGGFYWQALEETSAQNLRDFSAAWNTFRGSTEGQEFPSWSAAIASLFDRRTDTLVVLDEFGYLLDAAPEVPSLIQARLTPRSQREGRTRIVLCGSAFSQMRGLLSGGAPLRGRAELELVIQPFDFRTAAAYWKLDGNLDAAFQLHALVGGTPAYLALTRVAPTSGNVEKWMIEHLLDPASPLFREGRIVVAEDPTLADRALYWGILAALAEGKSRRADLAEALGRPATSIGFPTKVLTEGGWVDEQPDPFHPNRTTLHINDPIIRFYRLVIEPEQRRLTRGEAGRVARDARPIIARQIYGPHLEWMAAEWALSFASEATMGGSPRLVAPGVLQSNGKHQVDLVAVERALGGGDRIHAIGEVKAGREALGVAEVARLDDIVGKLGARAAPSVQRLLVSRSGFTQGLHRVAATRGDIQLVDLHRLYNGD